MTCRIEAQGGRLCLRTVRQARKGFGALLRIVAFAGLCAGGCAAAVQTGGGPDGSGTLTARPPGPEGLPDWLSRGVENTLQLRSGEAGTVISGVTDTSGGYQLISQPVALEPSDFAVRFVLSGMVKSGGLYAGLLDDSGDFLAPPISFGEGPVEAPEIAFLTFGNKKLTIVLGNTASGRQSEWEIARLGLQRIRSEPGSSFEADLRSPGDLPEGTVRLADNSARILSQPEGNVLSVRTDLGGGPQLGLKPVRLPLDATEIWFRMEGRVEEGAVFCRLLDERGKPVTPTQFFGQGPIRADQGLIPVGPRRAITLVLGNALGGQSSRFEIGRIELAAVAPGQRSSLVLKLARERRFAGSAWLWALRALLGRSASDPP